MNQYPKVSFYTLGCKLNFSETSTIARGFEEGGFAKVKFEDHADVYVINTCSVTDNADKKCRAIVRKAKRYNPQSKVVVVGCYAQLKPEEIVKIEGVDLVLGANEKFNVLQHLQELEGSSDKGKSIAGEIEEVHEFHSSYSMGDRTRTFLKVQDGCDYSCTFCTIPLARGKSRSQSIGKTLEVAQEVERSDCKEVVLTGVNIGDFGVRNNEKFIDLVKGLDLLNGNVHRYRISSIEPNLLSDDVINFVAESRKFVPHFHIPLQSGSPELLKRMRRRYKRDLYTDRVATIKRLMPEACIGVDVIVGFPGETEERFLETYEYLQQLPVSYFHVFTYSERDNTLAKELDEVVPKEVRLLRSKQLQILSQKKKHAFYESQLGKKYEVLWEAEKSDTGYMFGFTKNYVKVKRLHDEDRVNQFEQIILTEIDRDGIFKV